ncbi:MAG TPA: hypothetical protein VMQ93_18895 [Novosphingobium sp.]|nr:hypothetical protein [Novosphingobium sp.]
MLALPAFPAAAEAFDHELAGCESGILEAVVTGIGLAGADAQGTAALWCPRQSGTSRVPSTASTSAADLQIAFAQRVVALIPHGEYVRKNARRIGAIKRRGIGHEDDFRLIASIDCLNEQPDCVGYRPSREKWTCVVFQVGGLFSLLEICPEAMLFGSDSALPEKE